MGDYTMENYLAPLAIALVSSLVVNAVIWPFFKKRAERVGEVHLSFLITVVVVALAIVVTRSFF